MSYIPDMKDRSSSAKLTFKVDLPGRESRLREVILYVCDQCTRADRFGKVKLNKILWRADFSAFAERAVPVTGRSYQKLAAGPAPVEMPPMLAEMEADKLIDFESRDHGDGYVEERPRALAKANLNFFSPDDLSFVDSSVRFYWKKTATEASDLSHTVAWKSRAFLDPIPYEAVYLSDDKPTALHRARFEQIAKSMSLMTD